jgi:MerR family transcriptional regulator, light-induced transcriptional regulator
MNDFTIKDLENLSGVKAHTIRVWEQRYSFIKPQRTETNIRYYNCEELKTILNVALLAKNGFKISHIDKMELGEVSKHIVSLSAPEARQEKLVNELIQCMVNTNLEGFENILDNQILAKGLDKTITQVVFSFLDRTGILWQTGHINAGQEHIVTNIIRQKLIVGIEGVTTHVTCDKKALLFLPEGEFHELGLLYVSYLLKRRGARVFYMGSNVPLSDVRDIYDCKKPHFIYTHLACDFNLDRFIDQLYTAIPGAELVISGKACHKIKNRHAGHIHVKRSLPEVLEFISQL